MESEQLKKWASTAIAAFILVVMVLGYFLFHYIKSVEHETFKVSDQTDFEIEKGDTFYHLIEKFEKKGLIFAVWRLKWLVRLDRHYSKIKQGCYRIHPGDTVNQILNDFVQGNEILFYVTFIEGTRTQDAVIALDAAENLQHDIDEDMPLLEQLRIDEKHVEGLFFPDTYGYRHGENDTEILKRAYERLVEELDDAWNNRAEKLPYKNKYELLIMASIIEKETSVEEERTLVSAVFVNRLRKKMRLQTDPTVIYGMGERYKGNIRRKDLKEKTAYNTYQIRGLPPTPIALVGRASLQAAAHPADVNYLYFVSKNDGSHYFSDNLVDHEAAVDKYQRKRKTRK